MVMDFFPLYKEQMEEDELFKKLSPLKKCYYFLLQSMANKFGEFYYADMNFAAALNCSDEAIKKARREFVKNGWIEIVPGRRDKSGRGLATAYKHVKWANTPKKEEGKQFSIIPRYSFEMLLIHKLPLDNILVYLSLAYWKHLHDLEDGNFFITKTQLKNITGLQGMNVLEKCIDNLYEKFNYSGDAHLFEYKDQYHKFKFEKWALPADPSEDEGNYMRQKKFWDGVVKTGKDLQKKKQAKVQERELAEVNVIYDYFVDRYIDKYNNSPNPAPEHIEQLKIVAMKVGLEDLSHSIIRFFKDDIPGLSSSQRRTLKKFLELKHWKMYISK